MELKVGMYIRSKDKKGRQFIRRIVELPKDTRYGFIIVDKDIHNVKWVSMKNVLDAREDIIDLIKVGDYVNGELVTFVYEPDGNEVFRIELEKNTLQGHIISKSEQIKSIVTKEQFESMKYEVNKDE